LEKKLNSDLYYLNKIKEEQDKVGPGFCVLKWFHQEMHLGSGLNHSCYHCPTHKIPTNSDLHNTPHKKEQRAIMLQGGQPDECSYCWQVEDLDLISDRQTLAVQFFKHDPNIIAKATEAGLNDVYPKYLELSFTNKCQMKCSYCGPSFSSSWQKEMDEFGEYPLSQPEYHNGSEYKETNSPYIKRFWKWFPEAYKHLFVLRVTGGEPLLDKNTYKLLEYVSENPREGVSFHCNSNLMVSKSRVKRYTLLAKNIPESKLYVSIDSWGKQAEYIRHGLDMSHFEENLHTVLGNGLQVGLMITYNLLSIPNIDEFIFKVAELKTQYPGQLHWDSPHMTSPEHLSAQIANDKLINIMDKSLQTMKGYEQFTEGEYQKYRRTVEWIKNNRFTGEKLQRHRNDFVSFVREHDKRRNTSFTDSFGILGDEIIDDFN
jgi:organic radical activating enzyme